MKLTKFTLPDEKPDKGFQTEAGNKFRVKVIKQAQHEAPGGVAQAASTEMTLRLSVSLLNEDNSVAQLDDGYRIFEPVEIVIGQQQMANPNFDLAAIIQDRVEAQIEKAEQILVAQEKAAKALKSWGLDMKPETAEI